MDAWQMTDSERSAFADLADSLTPAQWDQPSLCDGWKVRDVVAHVADGADPKFGKMMLTAVKYGFRMNVMNEREAQKARRQADRRAAQGAARDRGRPQGARPDQARGHGARDDRPRAGCPSPARDRSRLPGRRDEDRVGTCHVAGKLVPADQEADRRRQAEGDRRRLGARRGLRGERARRGAAHGDGRTPGRARASSRDRVSTHSSNASAPRARRLPYARVVLRSHDHTDRGKERVSSA